MMLMTTITMMPMKPMEKILTMMIPKGHDTDLGPDIAGGLGAGLLDEGTAGVSLENCQL